MNIEKPVGYSVPIREQFRILRNTEVQGLADARQNLSTRRIYTRTGECCKIKGNIRFNISHGFAEVIKFFNSELCIGECVDGSFLRNRLWPGSENICSKDIQLCCFIDRLDGILLKE